MRLTPEQQAILDSRARIVFVSAAAGSGKTTLLVERYLRALLDQGIPMERIPTVTFTRKAAAEMRGRIRQRLIERGHDRVAWEVDGAPIGTIHSLCSHLLRGHLIEARVDPSFRVLDEEQAKILSVEAMSSAWNELVLGAEDDELDLLARHGKALRDDIPTVWNSLRQAGMARPTLGPPEPGDLDSERKALAEAIRDVSDRLRGGLDLKGNAAVNWEAVLGCAEWLPRAEPTWEGIELSRSFVPNMTCAAAVKPLFLGFKEALLEFRSALGRHYLAKVHALAGRLLDEYHGAYELSKETIGSLDFSDLEIRAADLLDKGVRPLDGRSYLLVDEFQDTNELQCRILDGLGAGGMLTVGDMYQSIYGFRGADVEVFHRRRRLAEAQATGGSGSEDSCVASLTVNFRSTEPLLRSINHIFGQESWFGAGFPALAHPDRTLGDPARPPADPPAPSPTPSATMPSVSAVEVIVVDPEGPLFEEGCVEADSEGSVVSAESAGSGGDPHSPESEAVADRVGGLLAEGRRKRDIVILLRAFTHVDEFEQALEDRGIDTYVVQGRGFYESEEIGDVLELLNVLVNPHDDRSVVAALRSPLVGLPDDVAFLLRAAADEGRRRFLWEPLRDRIPETVPIEYRGALERFVGAVSGLRERLGAPGLSTLIESAVEAFDYDLTVLRAPGGRRRLANLRKLMRLADEFETVEGPDLAAFIRHVRRRGDISGQRESSAPTLSEEEDVVRIMTVHKAKGLEFPVVIIPGMGSSRATSDKALVRASAEGVTIRLGSKQDALILGPYDRVRLADEELRRKEEDRLYYVACTRAKEHLVLVGLGREGCAPADNTPLRRVLHALGDPAIDAASPPAPIPGSDLPVVVSGVRVPGRARREPTPAPGPSRVCAPPEFPEARMGGAAAVHVSFSSIRMYEECPRAYYLDRVLGIDPDFVDMRTGRSGESGREAGVLGGGIAGGVSRTVGTLVHGALQAIDLRSPVDEAHVRRHVTESMRREGWGLDSELVERAVRLTVAVEGSPVPSWVASGAVVSERPFVFSHEGVAVSGYLDLVVEDERGWTIVDYKTNRLEGKAASTVADGYALQGRLYAMAGLLAGAERVRVAFLFLEAPTAPVVTEYLQSDLPGLRTALSHSLEGLLEGDYSGRSAHCGECSLAALCAVLDAPVGRVDPHKAIV